MIFAPFTKTRRARLHLFEKYFDTRLVVRCPVYRLPNATLFYVNPALCKKSLKIPCWIRHTPPKASDWHRLLRHYAVSITPLKDQKPVGSMVAFDAGRTVLCHTSPFRWKKDTYRDISLKGVGPITQFTGVNNSLNKVNTDGMLTLGEAYMDLARSSILRNMGVHVPLGLCIIDAGFWFRSVHSTTTREAWLGKSAIYVRAFTVNTRLSSLAKATQKQLKKYLDDELTFLSKVMGVNLRNYTIFLHWFATRLGSHAAKLQKVGYLHEALHAQQICLDAAICDFEHEYDTGFFENPRPDTKHTPGSRYVMGKQPQVFASLVADENTADNIWQIFRRFAPRRLPVMDELLETYWKSYRHTYDHWTYPQLHDEIAAYGLDMDEDLYSSLFQDRLDQLDYARLPEVIRWIKRPREK